MKNALIEAGVPENRIVLDYAGFRTLDSVLRCKHVFGQQKFIVVSQDFHLRRALFIARAKGVEAVGYKAGDYITPGLRRREYLARVKAVLDVYVLGTEPKFYGKKIEVGG